MLKKIIIVGGVLTCLVGVTSLSLINSRLGVSQNENFQYSFSNYSSTDNAIGAENINSMAFSQNNDRILFASTRADASANESGVTIATVNGTNGYNYDNLSHTTTSDFSASQAAFDPTSNNIAIATPNQGLNVGILNSTGESYTFENYTRATSGFGSSDGVSVAFTASGDIVYGSRTQVIDGTTYNGGITIGVPNSAKTAYNFTTYSSGSSALPNDNAIQVAGGPNNEVAYICESGGLTVGAYNSSSDDYTFTAYTSGDRPNLGSDDGTSVAFDQTANGNVVVGYATESNGFAISTGTAASSLTFTNYTSSATGISSDNGTSISFSDNGIVLYSATSESNDSDTGGISLGTKDDSGTYEFNNLLYDSSASDSISTNNVSGAAFNSSGQVGYFNATTGFGVGSFTALTAEANTQNISFVRRSQSHFDISTFAINLNYGLNLQPNNAYLRILIENSSGIVEEALYINSSGNVPSDADNRYPDAEAVPITNDTSYTFNNLTSNENGFAAAVNYRVLIAIGTSENNLEVINSSQSFRTPDFAPASNNKASSNLGLGLGLGLGAGIPIIIVSGIGGVLGARKAFGKKK